MQFHIRFVTGVKQNVIKFLKYLVVNSRTTALGININPVYV